MLPVGADTASTVRAMLASLPQQTYPHWEAWLPSGSAEDLTDGRIRVSTDHADQNGTRWLLRAIEEATGEYLIPVPEEARLARHALMEILVAIMASERA